MKSRHKSTFQIDTVKYQDSIVRTWNVKTINHQWNVRDHAVTINSFKKRTIPGSNGKKLLKAANNDQLYVVFGLRSELDKREK